MSKYAWLLAMCFYSIRPQPRQQAWSKQKEQKEKKMRRREIKELKRKRKNNLDSSDLQDLEDDTRLLKKLKKGKVSNGTVCVHVYKMVCDVFITYRDFRYI